MNETMKDNIEKAPIDILKMLKEFLAMNQTEAVEWARTFGYSVKDFQKVGKKSFKTNRVKHVILDYLIEQDRR